MRALAKRVITVKGLKHECYDGAYEKYFPANITNHLNFPFKNLNAYHTINLGRKDLWIFAFRKKVHVLFYTRFKKNLFIIYPYLVTQILYVMIIIRREEVEFNSKLNYTWPDWKMYAYSGRARRTLPDPPHGWFEMNGNNGRASRSHRFVWLFQINYLLEFRWLIFRNEIFPFWVTF